MPLTLASLAPSGVVLGVWGCKLCHRHQHEHGWRNHPYCCL